MGISINQLVRERKILLFFILPQNLHLLYPHIHIRKPFNRRSHGDFINRHFHPRRRIMLHRRKHGAVILADISAAAEGIFALIGKSPRGTAGARIAGIHPVLLRDIVIVQYRQYLTFIVGEKDNIPLKAHRIFVVGEYDQIPRHFQGALKKYLPA